MKIVLNRISNKISGAEIYNLYLLSSLKRYKDLQIIFLSNNKKLNSLVVKQGNISKYVNTYIDEIGTKKQLLTAIMRLPIFYFVYINFLISNAGINLMVLESMTEKIFLTPLLKLLKIHVVWIEHGPLFSTKRAKIIKSCYKIISRIVDSIICVSKSTEKDLVVSGISKDKTIVIYIGIDLKKYLPLSFSKIQMLRKQFKLMNSITIGYLGTVNKEKGIDTFLSTAKYLLSKSNKFRFIIIGDGDLLSWLKNEVKKLNISGKFLFTGFVSDIRKYLGITTLLFFPSEHEEGLSISLLESTSMGVPVVASSKAGIKEIILNKKNGIIYNESNVRLIAEDILNVLKNRKYYSNNARKIATQYFSSELSGLRFYNLFLKYEK